MTMRCDRCIFWKETFHAEWNADESIGTCSEIGCKIDIEISAGWEGGIVSNIETEGGFFCAAFKEKQGYGDNGNIAVSKTEDGSSNLSTPAKLYMCEVSVYRVIFPHKNLQPHSVNGEHTGL